MRILSWVFAVVYSLGSIYMIDEGTFNIYTLIMLIYAWLVVNYVEKNK